jgi:ribose transport system substrate-binding protein
MNDDALNKLLRDERMDRARVLRLGAATLILPSAAGLLSACGGDDEGPEAGQTEAAGPRKEPPWRVGRAGLGDLNDWMIFLSAHYDYAINVKHKDLFSDYIVTAANFDPTKQVADVEDLLAQNIDLLFIEPGSEGGLVGAVTRATASDVPVILVSTRVNGENWTSWISRNNRRDGELKGEWMGEKLGGKGQIVALMGFAGTSYANDVWAGTQASLGKFPDIEILEMQNADWSAPTAKQKTEAFLVKYNQIDGILSDGGQMALGAMQAFRDAGREIPPLTADDWNGWMRAASAVPDLQFYAVSGSANLSLDAVDLAVKFLQGEEIPKEQEAPFETWDQSELDKWFRPDLVAAYWGFNSLPEEFIKARFGRE